MKFCTNCGAQLDDAAVVCPKCGCAADASFNAGASAADADSGINIAAKIFMVLGCISVGWALIPLIWCIPMTVSFFHKVRDGRKVGVGFKICSLLFVNLIAGVLMLIRNEEKYND